MKRQSEEGKGAAPSLLRRTLSPKLSMAGAMLLGSSNVSIEAKEAKFEGGDARLQDLASEAFSRRRERRKKLEVEDMLGEHEALNMRATRQSETMWKAEKDIRYIRGSLRNTSKDLQGSLHQLGSLEGRLAMLGQAMTSSVEGAQEYCRKRPTDKSLASRYEHFFSIPGTTSKNSDGSSENEAPDSETPQCYAPPAVAQRFNGHLQKKFETEEENAALGDLSERDKAAFKYGETHVPIKQNLSTISTFYLSLDESMVHNHGKRMSVVLELERKDASGGADSETFTTADFENVQDLIPKEELEISAKELLEPKTQRQEPLRRASLGKDESEIEDKNFVPIHHIRNHPTLGLPGSVGEDSGQNIGELVAIDRSSRDSSSQISDCTGNSSFLGSQALSDLPRAIPTDIDPTTDIADIEGPPYCLALSTNENLRSFLGLTGFNVLVEAAKRCLPSLQIRCKHFVLRLCKLADELADLDEALGRCLLERQEKFQSLEEKQDKMNLLDFELGKVGAFRGPFVDSALLHNREQRFVTEHLLQLLTKTLQEIHTEAAAVRVELINTFSTERRLRAELAKKTDEFQAKKAQFFSFNNEMERQRKTFSLLKTFAVPFHWYFSRWREFCGERAKMRLVLNNMKLAIEKRWLQKCFAKWREKALWLDALEDVRKTVAGRGSLRLKVDHDTRADIEESVNEFLLDLQGLRLNLERRPNPIYDEDVVDAETAKLGTLISSSLSVHKDNSNDQTCIPPGPPCPQIYLAQTSLKEETSVKRHDAMETREFFGVGDSSLRSPVSPYRGETHIKAHVNSNHSEKREMGQPERVAWRACKRQAEISYGWCRYDEALRGFNQYIKISSEFDQVAEMAEGYHFVGTIYKAQGKLNHSIVCHLRQLELANQAGEPPLRFRALLDIAEVMGEVGESKRELEYLLEGLELARQLHDRRKEVDALQRLAAVSSRVQIKKSEEEKKSRIGLVDYSDSPRQRRRRKTSLHAKASPARKYARQPNSPTFVDIFERKDSIDPVEDYETLARSIQDSIKDDVAGAFRALDRFGDTLKRMCAPPVEVVDFERVGIRVPELRHQITQLKHSIVEGRRRENEVREELGLLVAKKLYVKKELQRARDADEDAIINCSLLHGSDAAGKSGVNQAVKAAEAAKRLKHVLKQVREDKRSRKMQVMNWQIKIRNMKDDLKEAREQLKVEQGGLMRQVASQTPFRSAALNAFNTELHSLDGRIPGGVRLAALSQGCNVYVYHLQSGRLVRVLRDSHPNDEAAELSSALHASDFGVDQDNTGAAVDEESALAAAVRRSRGQTITCVFFLKLDLYLGGTARVVTRWSATEGQRKTVYRGHGGTITALVADHRRVWAGSSDKTIRVWSKDTGEPLRVIRGHGRSPTALCFSANTLFSGSADGEVKVWRITFGRSRAADRRGNTATHSSNAKEGSNQCSDEQVSGPSKQSLDQVALSSPLKYAKDKKREKEKRRQKTMKAREQQKKKSRLRRTIERTADSRSHSPERGTSGQSPFWIQSVSCQEMQQGHRELDDRGIVIQSYSVTALEGTSADLVSGDSDGCVVIWDLASGVALSRFRAHDSGSITCISSSTVAVVTGGSDGQVKLFNILGQPLQTFLGHGDAPVRALQSNAGAILSLSHDGKLRKWQWGRERFSPTDFAHILNYPSETLKDVADMYGITIDDIRTWNDLGENCRLWTGKRLVVMRRDHVGDSDDNHVAEQVESKLAEEDDDVPQSESKVGEEAENT